MNIDLSPIMQAVEDVIARHERYIGYCKAREARKGLRRIRKAEAIECAVVDAKRNIPSLPNPALVFAYAASAGAILRHINGMPTALFCTEKPEIDPDRQNAFNRAKRATTVSVNYKGAPGYDVSGLVDCLNSELKGATIQ